LTITPEFGSILEIVLDLTLVIGTMTMSVSSSGQISPLEILNTLVESLSLENVRLANSKASVVIVVDEPIRDVSAVLDDKNERRAQASFTVRWAYQKFDSTAGFIDNVSIIESVRITRTSDNHDKTLVIDSTP
jgi:hypothetical protein